MTDADYVAEAKNRYNSLLQVPGVGYETIFVTLSGSHRFGFPSVDSDYDLRGCYVAPLREVFSRDLTHQAGYIETLEYMSERENPDDLVLQEARKMVSLLLKSSGSALEYVTSPMVIQTTPWHAELDTLARQCLNIHALDHYLGFFKNQLTLMRRRPDKQVKILLYIFRVLMTGIYLADTGIMEANIVKLNEYFKIGFIRDLIEEKIARENSMLVAQHQMPFYERAFFAMLSELEDAKKTSKLPSSISEGTQAELADWLYRLRTSKGY